LTKIRLFLKLEHVRVISWRPLREFGDWCPAAAGPLREWFEVASLATWRNFADLKGTFGQTDLVRVRSGQTVCVFDIGGNKFRLIAYVSYAKGNVYVLRVMSHREYDKGNQQWKDDL